jgi:D-2-hydroxyacid dehydrogenase (NADP+)
MKIWIETSALSSHGVDQLIQKYSNVLFERGMTKAYDAEVIVAMPQFVKPEILERFINLKWIQLLTAGFNTVDLEYICKRGIIITYAKDVFSIQIAEDVFSKILFLNRNLPVFHEQQKLSLWRYQKVNHELYGSTVGIIGTGSIGTEVAKRMKAFGATVIGYKRSFAHLPYYDQILYGEEGLHQLLSSSDYVIVSCPLSKETYHLIDHKAFQLMKKSAVIINVARGEIIDQEALIFALKSEAIRGAGLDVTTPEPLPESSQLWHLKNVIITPHNASSSPYVQKRLIDEVDDALSRYLNQLPFDNLVNP